MFDQRKNLFRSLLTGLGFTLKDLESVPFGVALPIREAIYRCREQPCSDWSEEVCLLIGRQDLTKQAHKMTLAKSKAVSVEMWKLPVASIFQFHVKMFCSCRPIPATFTHWHVCICVCVSTVCRFRFVLGASCDYRGRWGGGWDVRHSPGGTTIT